MRNVKFSDYEIVEDLANGTFKALRHGEEWRDLIGDKMVLALIDELDNYKELFELLKEDHSLQENWQTNKWMIKAREMGLEVWS